MRREKGERSEERRKKGRNYAKEVDALKSLAGYNGYKLHFRNEGDLGLGKAWREREGHVVVSREGESDEGEVIGLERKADVISALFFLFFLDWTRGVTAFWELVVAVVVVNNYGAAGGFGGAWDGGRTADRA